jgi:hypothetical protein
MSAKVTNEVAHLSSYASIFMDDQSFDFVVHIRVVNSFIKLPRDPC